jgi:hypothetical protein
MLDLCLQDLLLPCTTVTLYLHQYGLDGEGLLRKAAMVDAEMKYQAGPSHTRSNRTAQPPQCALLWSPIPILTWLLPPLGHMGEICR